LSQALFNVRQVTGDCRAEPAARFLDVRPDTLQFCRDSDYWLDLELFTTAHHESTLPGTANSLATLEQALALYRGPFMDGFSLPDSPAFEEWLLLLRERLERAAMQLLEVLVRTHMAQGAYEPALRFAWRQLELDPWREDVHRAIMQLLVMNGQRSAALAQYEACRTLLWNELGLRPEAQTTALFERIKAGSLGAPARPVFAPTRYAQSLGEGVGAGGEHRGGLTAGGGPPPGLPPNNLPVQLTPFIGREAELAAVTERLRRPDCRMLALVGPGGIGKTRLALEAARLSLHDFPHGVFLAPLVALQAPEALLPALATAIGLPLRPDKDVAQRLHHALRDRKMLLILDNFEHLLPGLEHLLQLLEATTHLKLLLTSRIHLRAQASSVFPVPGMALPARDADLASAAASDAVQLFVSGATRACGTFALTTETLPDAVAICHLVQGMPLALLLTTAWLPALSLGAIRARLAEEEETALDFMHTTWEDMPERHRSLRRVFDQSWELLSIQEQAVFQALAVLRGRFSRATAMEITGATLPELRNLIAKCCLQLTPAGAYEIHPLLRQYAAAKLVQQPEVWQRVRAQRSAYYATRLAQWATQLQGAEQRTAWHALELEIENAKRAWRWSAVQGNVAELTGMLPALGLYHDWAARPEAGLATCQLAAQRLEPNAAPEAREALAQVLAWMGRFHWFAGSTAAAVAALDRSLEVLETLDSESTAVDATRAFVLLQRGGMAMAHDRKQALEHYQASLALFRHVKQGWGERQALAALGQWGWHTNNLGMAREHLEAAQAQSREAGDTRTMLWVIQGLSSVAMSLGHFAEAASLSENCLALARDLGDALEISNACYSLGFKRVMLADFEAAQALFEECIRIHENAIGVPGTLAVSMMGYVLMFKGCYQEARTWEATALQQMQQASDRRGVGWTAFVLGSIELALGKVSAALDLLETSISAYRVLGQRFELSVALGASGWAHWQLGQVAEAQRALVETLRIALEARSTPTLSYAIPGMALLLAFQGQAERAVELYAPVEEHFPVVRHSPWFADLARTPILDAAAALPPERLAAARARGCARELWATAAALEEEFGAGL
jgi:predicted ATPase/DNA-binding SARP family transcriptional activator